MVYVVRSIKCKLCERSYVPRHYGQVFCSKTCRVMYRHPRGESGRGVYDSLSPVEAVIAAWTIEGRDPSTHQRFKARVTRENPVLARALDRLVREYNHKK